MLAEPCHSGPSPYLAQLLKRLWAQLGRLGGTPQLISFNRAKSKLCSIKCPGTLLLVSRGTTGCGEDSHESLEAAELQLERKRAPLPEQRYGNVDFILAYAAGAQWFQWYYIPGVKRQACLLLPPRGSSLWTVQPSNVSYCVSDFRPLPSVVTHVVAFLLPHHWLVVLAGVCCCRAANLGRMSREALSDLSRYMSMCL